MSETQIQIKLAQRPIGLPDDDTFEITEAPIQTPEADEVLVRVEMVSLDPAMRGWLDDRKSYLPPVGIGQVMRALGVGTVVASNFEGISVGDRVSGGFGWQEYASMMGTDVQPIPPGAPLELALGPLGMTGMTAYFGLLDVGEPKEGDTVLVSGAAGAVGSMVGQIAKLKGCRVVGIAGSDDKCAWLEDLGFDAAINYKTTESLYTAVGAACPKGLDLFFDNIGGHILDIALAHLNLRARVVICGAISAYNATEPVPGPANYLSLLVNRARMQGFIVFDYAPRYREAVTEISRWIEEGKIQARYDIVYGLENAPKALLRLFDGSNTGKLIVRVAAV